MPRPPLGEKPMTNAERQPGIALPAPQPAGDPLGRIDILRRRRASSGIPRYRFTCRPDGPPASHQSDDRLPDNEAGPFPPEGLLLSPRDSQAEQDVDELMDGGQGWIDAAPGRCRKQDSARPRLYRSMPGDLPG
jgi:hypothetical protein